MQKLFPIILLQHKNHPYLTNADKNNNDNNSLTLVTITINTSIY